MGSTIDMLATLASLSGTKAPSDRKMDSYDLSPLLLGTDVSPRQEFFYWNTGQLNGVRSGPWKLHTEQREAVNYSRRIKLEKPELYNLEKDISEAYNVADEHPEIVASLLQMLEKHKEHTADSLPEQLGARIPGFKYQR
jgi:arylsulfatase A-like enzyme